jgi:hypothetical protein
MQVMLTNRTSVQVPILAVRGGKWFSDMLQPGIETTIAGDNVTKLLVGKADPGAAPSDPDSVAARTRFLAGITAMEGRSDIGAAQQVTLVRLLIDNFSGDVDVNDGTESIAVLAKNESKEVAATQFTLAPPTEEE